MLSGAIASDYPDLLVAHGIDQYLGSVLSQVNFWDRKLALMNTPPMTAIRSNRLATPNLVMESARPKRGLSFTFWGVACALVGGSSPFVLHLVGEIYLGELLIIPLAFAALFARKRESVLGGRVFVALCFAGVVTLLGYMLSDVVRGTDPSQYLRGWGRVVLMITDFVSLSILTTLDRRNLWWFCLGLSVGVLSMSGLIEHLPLRDNWKLIYARAIAYLLLCFGWFWGPRTIVIALLLLAVVGVALDSRAEPFLLLLMASIYWARRDNSIRRVRKRVIVRRLTWPLVIGSAVLAMGLVLTAGDFANRREQSNEGRISSTLNGVRAIMRSPVIGLGSWNEDETQDSAELETDELGVTRSVSTGPPHSQILDAWYEGGILGAAFFFTFGVCVWGALSALLFNVPLEGIYGLLLYSTIVGMWDLFMSPFAGNHRLTIMLAVSSIVISQMKIRRKKRVVRDGYLKSQDRRALTEYAHVRAGHPPDRAMSDRSID